MSMRRHNWASTSIRGHCDVICLLDTSRKNSQNFHLKIKTTNWMLSTASCFRVHLYKGNNCYIVFSSFAGRFLFHGRLSSRETICSKFLSLKSSSLYNEKHVFLSQLSPFEVYPHKSNMSYQVSSY